MHERRRKLLAVSMPRAEYLPPRARRALKKLEIQFTRFRLRFGIPRRLTPYGRGWGHQRGLPIDRYYIETFLASHSQDIRGRVMEIEANRYTKRFGAERVTQSDILDISADNPNATIVADLVCATAIPSDSFDCIICTQTLLLIYDVWGAIRTLYRILKPGAVLLVTVPGVAHKIAHDDAGRWGDYWRFTSISARRLFTEVFPPECVEVEAFGNVLTASAFLHALAAEDLSPKELSFRDPDFELTVALRAVKPG
jgi:SAM-dependent methyltransferase